jgi:beta-glucosidase
MTIGLAASMNPELAERYGRAIGEECRHWGVDYLLGPGINIYRVHQNGRNFEYMGADPYMAGTLASRYIMGLQSTGTGATLKHLAANNTDWMRCGSDSVMSERTLREIYLKAFQIAVEHADPLSIMTAYNLIGGEYASEHKTIMTDIVRDEWGFQGFFMSDWSAIRDSKKAFNAGLDQECPVGRFFSPDTLTALLDSAEIREEELDRKVAAILCSSMRAGMYERELQQDKDQWPANHPEVAKAIAREGIVLLKNEDKLLPVPTDTTQTIALLGTNLFATAATGGGAAMFRRKPYTNVSIASALSKLLPQATLTGVTEARFAPELDAAAADLDEPDGIFNQMEGPQDAVQPDIPLDQAREIASQADLVIVGTGSHYGIEREGRDCAWQLPPEQYELIDAVLAVNPNVIVVNVSGTGFDMAPFADRVKAVVQVFFPGEHGGEPVAEMLTGAFSPSGKLPFTLGRKAEDHHWFGNYLPEDAELYSEPIYNIDGVRSWTCRYGEGILNDYRWFDAHGIEPLFPFGHGLSYSEFAFSDLQMRHESEAVQVSVTVENTGGAAAAEVVQIYVEDVECTELRPPRELAAFGKVMLEPGESKALQFTLDRMAFLFWSEEQEAWTVEPGRFMIHVARSSRQVCLSREIEHSG